MNIYSSKKVLLIDFKEFKAELLNDKKIVFVYDFYDIENVRVYVYKDGKAFGDELLINFEDLLMIVEGFSLGIISNIYLSSNKYFYFSFYKGLELASDVKYIKIYQLVVLNKIIKEQYVKFKAEGFIEKFNLSDFLRGVQIHHNGRIEGSKIFDSFDNTRGSLFLLSCDTHRRIHKNYNKYFEGLYDLNLINEHLINNDIYIRRDRSIEDRSSFLN